MYSRKRLITAVGIWLPLSIGVALSEIVNAERPLALAETRRAIDKISWSQAHAPVGPAAKRDSRLAEALSRKSALLERDLGDECAVVVHAPFVLAGDMSKERLNRWYRDTISPATIAFSNTYFDVEPNQPITVLLFTGEASYNRFAKQLFGDKAISIYGYYRPRGRR